MAKEITPQQATEKPIFNNALNEWISKLSACESTNNPLAVNPFDLDGTASHGRFQFKFDTWKFYIQKYKLFNYTDMEDADYWNLIYDGSLQEIVLRNMIHDPEVDFSHEFPACVKRYGWPPV